MADLSDLLSLTTNPRPAHRPRVVAHRGASAYAPENTLPAIELALAMGADMVEIDVHATADGALVVVHDPTLARTTDASARLPGRAPWLVGDLTLNEVRRLDAGSWKGREFAGTGVPTLREALDALRGRAGLLLEVKNPGRRPGLESVLVAELEEAGWVRPAAADLVVQSFDWAFMAGFHARAPRVTVGLLGGPPPDLAEVATWADQVNPCHTRLDAATVDRIHAYGLQTVPYTVNDPARMSELLTIGVDGVISDRPDVLRHVAGTVAVPMPTRRHAVGIL